jgi:signal transduction histidine kinase/ActR/RegA family two-component response regulator
VPGPPRAVEADPLSGPAAERVGLRLVEIARVAQGADDEPKTLADALERLTEAEGTLRAIGAGEVDAFVISDDSGRSVFTLSSADRLYRMFVENMRDGAATLAPGGLILYANQRLADLLSCSKEELVGSPLVKFVAGDIPFELENVDGAGGLGATAEIDLLGCDDVVIPVLVGASALEVDGDQLACLTFTDLRAQKLLEEQLRHAQRMESIGSLAGGIAHDFNNMLTVILGYSSVLVRETTDATSQHAVEQIDRAAMKATDLTAQLLAFSRQQVMQPEVTDANAVVAETLKLLDRLLGDDILLEQRLHPDLASILVDRSQLGQVILNLAVNGRDAMVDGGTLALRTENVELDDAYAATHRGVVPGRYVLLQVSDSGVGMDEETRERVFDPFFTTKGDGTGLGLSTVYGIVKQSGGHASVYSEEGLGTTFKVYFPVTDSQPLPAAPRVEGISPEGNETILLVEDDEPIRLLVSRILGAYGYTVLAVADGQEALALVADGRTRPIDLLLTDVVLPGMNGREVADKLTIALPGLRVLFTSGYPSDTILRHGIAEARNAFIQKPYLVDELARKIRELLTSDA